MPKKPSIHHAGRTATLFLLFTAFFIAAIPYRTAHAAAATGVAIPLYTYPGGTWDTVIQAKNANPSVPIIAVINPNSGPGGSRDISYVQGIQNLRSAAVKVLGYVYTGYASRSISSVEADINAYKSWYAIDGIFFDEMSNVPGNENYYSSLNQYVKSIGMTLTMGNPGTSVPSSYMGTEDILVIYEDLGLPTISYLSSIVQGYAKTNFGTVSYGVGSLDTTWVSSASNDVGYMYITDDNLPNPYDSLPSYFSNLVAALSTQSSPPPPTSTILALNIQSVNLTGAPITGLATTIQSGSSTVYSGYTPETYSGTSGTTYQVTVADSGTYTFNHWDDGSTNRVRTLTLTQATTLTAYYSVASSQPPPPPTPNTIPLTIRSADLTGAPIIGLWTAIQSNGQTVGKGYTTLTYNATIGATYTVSVANYGPYTFNHWDNGATSNSRTLTPTQAMTLTAYYSFSTHPVRKHQLLTFSTSPTVGSITFNGTSFLNNQIGNFTDGEAFAIANPPIGYTFAGWSSTDGLTVAAPTSVATQVSVAGSGTLTANFTPKQAHPISPIIVLLTVTTASATALLRTRRTKLT